MINYKNMKAYYSKVRDVKSPTKKREDAGWDFYIPEKTWVHPGDFEDCEYILSPGEDILIPSGIHLDIPENHCGIFFNKSGIATKKHLQVMANVIDSGYMGELHIHLHNVGKERTIINNGEKIIQLIFFPFRETELIEKPFDQLYLGKTSERKEGGFGSTN